MTKTEITAIANDETGIYTSEQKAKAQAALADLQKPNTEEFDPNAEMWASYARSFRDPAFRAQVFEDFREKYKNDPVALKSFTPEREHLRAKRNVYDQHGGDVIGQAYDEDIHGLLQAKGWGYFGTIAYYAERKGMTQEAASQAAAQHRERQHTNAIFDDDLRSGTRVKDCTNNTMMHLGAR